MYTVCVPISLTCTAPCHISHNSILTHLFQQALSDVLTDPADAQVPKDYSSWMQTTGQAFREVVSSSCAVHAWCVRLGVCLCVRACVRVNVGVFLCGTHTSVKDRTHTKVCGY